MSIKLWNTDINKIYLWPTEIKKTYLGSTLIYDKTATPNWLLNNLVSYYEFENNALDSHGTNNWTNFWTSDVAGKIGRGRSFDWVNDYVSGVAALWTSWTSLFMWINQDTTVTQYYYNLRETMSNANNRVIFYYTSWLLRVFNTNWWNTLFFDYAIDLSTWGFRHIWFTHNWNWCKLYVDWVEVASWNIWAIASVYTIDDFRRLGSRWDWAVNYDGVMDEPWIWNRELTQTDVDNLYNNWAWLSYDNFTT